MIGPANQSKQAKIDKGKRIMEIETKVKRN